MTKDGFSLRGGSTSGGLRGKSNVEKSDEETAVEEADGDLKTLGDALKSSDNLIAKEQAQFRDVTDSEFWFCVCFRDREAKEAFLLTAGLLQDGDKYVDGHAFAKKIGIDLKNPQPFSRQVGIKQRLASLARGYTGKPQK